MLKKELGFCESKYVMFHDKYFGHGSCAGVFGIEGMIDKDVLQEALYHIFQRHPLLQAVLPVSSSNQNILILADFCNIPINISQKTNENDWEKIMEVALSTPFETSKYMWRFYFLIDTESNYHEFIINTHHSISDGLSIVNMGEEILQTYICLLNGIRINNDKLELLPSIETLIGQNPNKFPFEKSSSENSDMSEITYHKDAPIELRKTKSIYQTTDELSTLKLIQKCKENKSTVGSALGAIMLLTAKEVIGDNLSTQLFTPVSLRPYCYPPIESKHIGFYITTVLTHHNMYNIKNDIWAIARNYKEKLNLKIFEQINQIQELPPGIKYSESSNMTLTNKFNSGFGVVNKGKLNITDNFGPIKIRFYYATVSKQAGDKPMCVSLNSLHDKSFLRFSYTEPLIDKIWADEFVKTFMAKMCHITS